MSHKKKKNSKVEQWIRFDGALGEYLPHVQAWWGDPEAFLKLQVNAREDGTCLAIAKGYSSDGTPVVCFGSGYGVAGALMALDATLQGGRWRPDKPWPASGK